MRTSFLLALCLTGLSQAQTLPNMQAPTAAQRLSIARSALAFTGRSCASYGVRFTPIPADLTPAQVRAGLEDAASFTLEMYRTLGVPVTKVSRSQGGGVQIYLATDPSYMQVIEGREAGRRVAFTWGCVLH